MTKEVIFNHQFIKSIFTPPDRDIKLIEAKYIIGKVSHSTFVKNEIHTPLDFEEMVNKRRSEHLAGRICAKAALLDLNCHGQVKKAKDRSPIWPSGFVGSISHTTDRAVACVANNAKYRYIGIDVETIIDNDLANKIASELLFGSDRYHIDKMPINQLVTLTFSTKEALFKALYRDVGYIFGFEDVCIVYVDKSEVVLEIQKDLSNTITKGALFKARYKKCASAIYSGVFVKL